MSAQGLSRRQFIITAGATVFGLGLVGCSVKGSGGSSSGSGSAGSGQSGTQQAKWKTNLTGKDGALCGSPIYIADAKGYFKDEGLDLTLISADTETRKTSLNNGDLPLTNGDFQFFPSIEQGVNVSVVDGLHNGCIKLVVLPDSDLSSAADLKGKKIAVDEIGGTPHQVASVWLENAGIKADQSAGEVTFVQFSDGNLELEALYSGDVDVAALWDPLGSIAEKDGKVKTILDITKDEPFAGKFCCFLYASNKVLEEDPEEVYAVLRAIRKAQDYIAKNPEDAVDTIIEGKYSAIDDRDLAIELVKSYGYPTAEDRASGKHDVKGEVEYFAEQLHNIGYLESDADTFTKKAYFEVTDEAINKNA